MNRPLREFATMVAAMRSAQALVTAGALLERRETARHLEQLVDQAVARIQREEQHALWEEEATGSRRTGSCGR